MDLAERLGVAPEQVDRLHLVERGHLRDPDTLLSEAFALGQDDPEAAQTLLAAALLSAGRQTQDGRHASMLMMLAPIVAHSDPLKTLGPDGEHARAQAMPNGWKHTLASPDRLRYAWREGMEEILDLQRVDPSVINAMDEVSRLAVAEPEPVRVAIQQTFPAPKVAFGVALISLLFSLRGWWTEIRP